MGCDFVLISLACKGNTNENNDMDVRLTAATRAITRLTMAEARTLDKTGFIPRNDKNEVDLAVTKQALRKSLAAVRAAVQHGSRDVTTVPAGAGIILYITGGPSWGDSPTELYNDFCSLVISGFPDAREEHD